MAAVLCVDVGSTFTKAVLLDPASGTLLAAGSEPTRLPPSGDVLDGIAALRARLAGAAGVAARSLGGDGVLVCSSAGGGLRIAVVGYEELVSAEAGQRVALTAGGRVVHVAAGALDTARVEAVRDARPDVVLLVGGTDGGNAEVLLHNARRLGVARLPAPVVLAGNADAAEAAAGELRRHRRRVVVAGNVLPQIGAIAPASARSAIRDVFLDHVIGGKGLSRKHFDGRRYAALVRAATPDAMLAAVTLLAETVGDCLVVDVGGATTDVYSAITPAGEDAALRREVVAPLWHARTVEGDLGLRWGAAGVVAAAEAEALLDGRTPAWRRDLRAYAELVASDPAHLAGDEREAGLDTQLAALAARVAVRRHGRPAAPGAEPRPLRDVAVLVGSGGVLRHGDEHRRRAVLEPLTRDHGGGWRAPERARVLVDTDYVLFAAGLLVGADRHDAARAVLARAFR